MPITCRDTESSLQLQIFPSFEFCPLFPRWFPSQNKQFHENLSNLEWGLCSDLRGKWTQGSLGNNFLLFIYNLSLKMGCVSLKPVSAGVEQCVVRPLFQQLSSVSSGINSDDLSSSALLGYQKESHSLNKAPQKCLKVSLERFWSVVLPGRLLIHPCPLWKFAFLRAWLHCTPAEASQILDKSPSNNR